MDCIHSDFEKIEYADKWLDEFEAYIHKLEAVEKETFS